MLQEYSMYLKCGLDSWPDSSTGGALHWHCRGRGLNPHSGLNF